MLFKNPDGSVHYRLGDSLPPGAVEITVDQLQNIPAPPETSDSPGASESRKPLPIEQSLQLMLDEKADITSYSLGKAQPSKENK